MGTKTRNKKAVIFVFLPVLLLLPAENAFAMHISEGILPLGWALIWYAASAPFVFYGLWRLKKVSRLDIAFKPLAGLLAAMVFIISALPVPVPTAGTCSHPCGTGISGILLGPGISVLVATVALLLQALFLAHGGISTLGANVFSMGVAGSVTGYVVFKSMRRLGIGLMPSGFAAGLLADWVTYLATSFELASGIRGGEPLGPLFAKIAIAFIPAQLPIGILEGFMTAGMVVLLSRKRPDILVKLNVIRKGEALA
ncbi:MAG: energy-coupling factor ABC transporter permease [Nitrospiraceae bacterium]|nr:energy-coupling factor ABC transporter permease [Nitrospiraceae bacterium]